MGAARFLCPTLRPYPSPERTESAASCPVSSIASLVLAAPCSILAGQNCSSHRSPSPRPPAARRPASVSPASGPTRTSSSYRPRPSRRSRRRYPRRPPTPLSDGSARNRGGRVTPCRGRPRGGRARGPRAPAPSAARSPAPVRTLSRSASSLSSPSTRLTHEDAAPVVGSLHQVHGGSPPWVESRRRPAGATTLSLDETGGRWFVRNSLRGNRPRPRHRYRRARPLAGRAGGRGVAADDGFPAGSSVQTRHPPVSDAGGVRLKRGRRPPAYDGSTQGGEPPWT